MMGTLAFIELYINFSPQTHYDRNNLTLSCRVFQIALKGEGMGNFVGENFLSSGGNLRSVFDHSNLFQS